MRLPAFCVIVGLTVGGYPALAQNDSNDRNAGPVVSAPASAGVHKRKRAAVKPSARTPAAKPTVQQTAPAANPSPTVADGNTGIPLAERLAIQAALSWAGDYGGGGNGDDPFVAAVKSFQKRNKSKLTGVLTASERAVLLAAAKQHEEEFGWRVVDDPATGARIGLPTKMVPLTREAGGGSRWSSRHGDVQVETFKIKEPDTTLPAVFEQQKKGPPSRQIEYSALRADSFIISGLQGLKKFSVRAHIKDGEVRGLILLFDQAMEGIMAPVMTAMASTFAPFPAPGAQLAAVTPKKVEYATAMIVSPAGHLITDRKVTQGCQVIVAAGLGNAERVAEDKTNELALLQVYGARKLAPFALAGEAPQGNDVTLIGVPEPRAQDGDKAVKIVTAKLIAVGTTQFLQPPPISGFSGAAALDREGRFFGMVESRNAVVASAQPAAPQAAIVPAEAIRTFLSSHKITPLAGPRSIEDAKASVVRVICVRK